MQALWMIVAAFLFSLMGVCVKFASAHYSTTELVCYRGVVSALFMAVWVRSTGVGFATKVPGMHAWRSVIGVVSLGGWFYAIMRYSKFLIKSARHKSEHWGLSHDSKLRGKSAVFDHFFLNE
jgi:drug/metabolite transporter (DMT)-like permease